MGILAKLFGATPQEQLEGVSLGKSAYWEVSPVRDFPALLEALPQILPQGAILYLEGGTPPKEINTFLNSHCVPEETHLAMGTIWPKPLTFHLPATVENLTQLAKLTRKCPAMQIAVHLHVYHQGKVFLEWYDAFWKDPFYLSDAVVEERLKDFCSSLSLTYKGFSSAVGAPSL
jgi:hypothetical protein